MVGERCGEKGPAKSAFNTIKHHHHHHKINKIEIIITRNEVVGWGGEEQELTLREQKERKFKNSIKQHQFSHTTCRKERKWGRRWNKGGEGVIREVMRASTSSVLLVGFERVCWKEEKKD